MYLKLKKLLKKMNIFAINVLNFYKKLKMKLALKYTLFGMKMRNIEYVQTFTVHLLITYLEKKMLAIKMAIYQKKLLVFI